MCKAWVKVNAWSLGTGLACGSILADVIALRPGSLASTAILLVTGSAIVGARTARALSQLLPERHQHVSS
jgi:hypothetical protein